LHRSQAECEDPNPCGSGAVNAHTDYVLFSDFTVLEGRKYVIIADDQNFSFNDHIVMGVFGNSSLMSLALREDTDPTPLQEKSNNLAELTATIVVVLVAGSLFFFFSPHPRLASPYRLTSGSPNGKNLRPYRACFRSDSFP